MTYEPWIGDDPTGSGCRVHWAPGWPACGEPVTLHVMSESAIDGVVCLPTCERHARHARDAGVYVDEHSPSYPGCRCTPRAVEAAQSTRSGPASGLGSIIPGSEIDVPRLPGAVISVRVRPPYDPDLERRLRESRHVIPYARDGLTHYWVDREGLPSALCGVDVPLPVGSENPYVVSRNWRIVSCPTCRVTETP